MESFSTNNFYCSKATVELQYKKFLLIYFHGSMIQKVRGELYKLHSIFILI